eukprot:6937001-Prymnesium_polylepis.1
MTPRASLNAMPLRAVPCAARRLAWMCRRKEGYVPSGRHTHTHGLPRFEPPPIHIRINPDR